MEPLQRQPSLASGSPISRWKGYCIRREEGNEPAKLEIIRCLGAWCIAADALPAEAQTQFERGLGEKDTLLQAHLTALVQVNPAGSLYHVHTYNTSLR